jgi:hypothetical protein
MPTSAASAFTRSSASLSSCAPTSCRRPRPAGRNCISTARPAKPPRWPGASLLFSGPGPALVAATALSVASDDGDDGEQPGWHRVQLDREFDYAQFDHSAPQVTVYGNLVEATQGKTEARITLGDGDARAGFPDLRATQDAADLSARHDAGAAAAAAVAGVGRWRRLDARRQSFSGVRPGEHVYVVREDADGKSWVQFGDGKSGARLRSGRGNVRAVYRSRRGCARAAAGRRETTGRQGRSPDSKRLSCSKR